MRRRRVLVVDHSVILRRAIAAGLACAPGILVAGAASNGRIALMKIPLLLPDVVVLGLEMPETGGLETLSAIRAAYPTLPVIVLSPPDARAGVIEALARGAVASLDKPTLPSGRVDRLCDELGARILQHCPEEPCFTPRKAQPHDDVPLPAETDRTDARVDVLAIAVSTGGPSALMDLIPRFPKDFPVPIVIVQHMPATFTTLLAERLALKSRIRVAEGRAGQTLAAGCALIAPGDFHMAVARDGHSIRLRLHQEPPENSCRPAADVLFRSVASVYGSHVLAVVMTGMGRDGFVGCERIREAGGQIIVQDEQSSVVWGMPSFVVSAGLADQILSLTALGPEIIRKVGNHRRRAAAPAFIPALGPTHAVEKRPR